MKKRTRKIKLAIILILIVGLLLSTQTAIYAADPQITVKVHGESIVFAGQQPVIVDNRTLVPVRGVFEALGFYVEWDAEGRRVILTRDDDTMILTIGSNVLEFNGERSPVLDVAPQIIGGSTMLPLRFPIERVGYVVTWEQATRTISIIDAYTAGNLILETDPFNIAALRMIGLSDREISDVFGQEVLRLSNIERANYGLAPLRWSDNLATASFNHSVDMYENNFFSHTGSDGSDPGQRIRRAGHSRWTMVAENVAAFQRTPDEVVSSWMNSPGHRSNILHNRLVYMGASYYNTLWTQKFMRL